MTRWAMVADLRRCVGCQTCTAACKHTNATPPSVQWRKVLDIESGEFPDVTRTFVPVGCQHCADPPCMEVCPSTATGQRADGIVTIDYDLCIGCAFCAVACPYQARYKVDYPSFAYGRGAPMANEIARDMPERLGVAQKCTFCSDRVDYGLENGLTPGIDPEATPACVNSCIASALHFGDMEDANSNVSKLVRDNKTNLMHPELDTKPGFHYIWGTGPDDDGDATAAEHTPLPPVRNPSVGGSQSWLQHHWDWRAACNFMFGGTGTGLMIAIGFLAVMLGTLNPWMVVTALAFVGAGLFMVFLEVGRPWRAPRNVFFHPQTSWMTREGMAGAVLMPVGLFAILFDLPFLVVPAAAIAAFYLYAQGRILRQSKGIPVWRSPGIVALIVSTGLAEGAGMFVILATLMGQGGGPLGAFLIVFTVLLRTGAWVRYRAILDDRAPTHALREIERLGRFNTGVALLPAVFLVVAGALTDGFSTEIHYAGAGAFALLSGWWIKFALITKAAYNQGFTIPGLPERGTTGDERTGTIIHPGWG